MLPRGRQVRAVGWARDLDEALRAAADRADRATEGRTVATSPPLSAGWAEHASACHTSWGSATGEYGRTTEGQTKDGTTVIFRYLVPRRVDSMSVYV